MEEPRNAASDRTREVMLLWSDRAAIENELPSKLAPGFVRHDRRRLISMPSSNADEFTAQMLDLCDLMSGQMSNSIREVLEIRDDRLVVARTRIEGGGNEMDFILLAQMDEAVNQIEIVILFDPDDVDAPIAELDRLHEQLAHD